ncbi:hypothetical protein ACROYT_G001843 [Oculina patagonica]
MASTFSGELNCLDIDDTMYCLDGDIAELNQEEGDDCTRCIGMLVREYIWLFVGVSFCAELDCKDSDSSMRCIDDELDKESIRLIVGPSFVVKLIWRDWRDGGNKTLFFDHEIPKNNRLLLVSTFSGELECGGVDDKTSCLDDDDFKEGIKPSVASTLIIEVNR